jgi:hypothetical protein
LQPASQWNCQKQSCKSRHGSKETNLKIAGTQTGEENGQERDGCRGVTNRQPVLEYEFEISMLQGVNHLPGDKSIEHGRFR